MPLTIFPLKVCSRSPSWGLWALSPACGVFKAVMGPGRALRTQLWGWPLAVQMVDSDSGPVLESCVHWEMRNKAKQGKSPRHNL